MSTARLLALDWGTSSLRAFALDHQGTLLETREWPWGILRLPGGGFEAALRGAAGRWMRPGLPVIASGMVGSAQGWHEASYLPCPADAHGLSRALLAFRAAGGEEIHIVPGLLRDGERPDVMRGEETQIVGALQGTRPLPADCTVVLPGTHSKWARVRGSRVVDFDTYMTGELFAVLRDHSILGRPAAAAPRADAGAVAEAFERGVRMVLEHPECGIGQLLFSARTLVLTKRMPAEHSLEYLSGLLIGDEVRCALGADAMSSRGVLALVGDAALCERYRRALALAGVDEVPIVDDAAVRGLWAIARAAGLLAGG